MSAATRRRLLLFTLLGTVIGVGLCLADLAATRDSLGGLVTSSEGLAQSDIIMGDLPDETGRSGGSHDGAYYYIVARDPFHLSESAGSFDIPRYRMQRIGYPIVAWALHPFGGGPGLMWTMFAVNVAGVVLGGFATGRISVLLGGPPWPAAIFAPMFGSIVSMRISVSDALALALLLTAFLLSLKGRHGWAVAVAVATALTKETSLLLLLGFAGWRRDREGAALFAIPLAAVGAWWLFLAVQIGGPNSADNFVAPFRGWADSWSFWTSGPEPLGFVSIITGVGIAVAALVLSRPRHPLWWPLLLTLASSTMYSIHVLAPERNASRMVLPLQILGIIVLVTRSYPRHGVDGRHPEEATATPGPSAADLAA